MAEGFSRKLFHLAGHSSTCLISLNIIRNVIFIPPFSSYLETVISVQYTIIFTVTGSRLKISHYVCSDNLKLHYTHTHTQLPYQIYTNAAITVQFNSVLTSEAQLLHSVA